MPAYLQGDTARPRVLGTHTDYLHILSTFSDIELNNVATIAKSFDKGDLVPSFVSSTKFSMREAQIHGDIIFDRDIRCCIVSKRHSSDHDLNEKIELFCLKYGIAFVNDLPIAATTQIAVTQNSDKTSTSSVS